MRFQFSIFNTQLLALLLALGSITASAQEVSRESTYEVLVRQAFRYMSVDSLEAAEAAMKQAVAVSPAAATNVLLLKHLAQIAERRGDNVLALDYYNLAIGQDDKGVDLLLGRAALQMKMGNENAALADYATVLTLSPDNSDALLMRAVIYRKRHQWKDARADYERLLSADATNLAALTGLALVNDADRRPVEAMENINLAIAMHPRSAAPYAIRAGMKMQRKLWDDAEADYAEAIKIEPDNPAYYLARAQFYHERHNSRAARADIQRAAQLQREIK